MRRALGKGLSELIGEQSDSAISEVSVTDLVPNQRQPRTVFDEQALDELAASIREHGILQPLVVRPVSEGRYEIIAGERRFRAAQRAGLERVPVIVRAAGARASLELALIENLQREDIGALEAARAYRRLADEFGLKQEEIAERVGKSRVSITNTLRLLKLPREVQEGLEAGQIGEGHARAILAAEGESAQLALFRRALATGMTVRDLERATKPSNPRAKTQVRKSPARDPVWNALQEELSVHFGAPARLEPSETGGRLVVEFYSDDDLQRILDVLGIQL